MDPELFEWLCEILPVELTLMIEVEILSTSKKIAKMIRESVVYEGGGHILINGIAYRLFYCRVCGGFECDYLGNFLINNSTDTLTKESIKCEYNLMERKLHGCASRWL